MEYYKIIKIGEKTSAMEKLKLLTNLNLKLSTGIVPSKSEFHPLIVRGKKEKKLKNTFLCPRNEKL